MINQQQIVDLLLKKGIIDNSQLSEALKESGRSGLSIEKTFEKLGFVSEVEIAQILADSLGVPFIDLRDYLIDSEVIKLIPESLAKKYKAVPLFKIGNTLTVAMVDPLNITAIDEIRLKSKMDVIETVLSTANMIQNIIDQYYGVMGNAADLVKSLAQDKTDAKGKADSPVATEELSVIKLVNLILMQAVKDRASDIHIEPDEDKVRIRYRVDGVLQEIQNIPKHLQSALASRIKVMAEMDIAEIRNPQDGRMKLKMENKNLDIRVSSFPTIHGENLVLRILDKSAVLLGLAELGFLDEDLNNFHKVIKQPNGIILVTGPTGSGKTTTLYSAISVINSIDKNIITIEDPVEYELPLIRQTQVNQKAGLTFAVGLRSILRQDPDIVMVGEIRDKETAEIATRASLTGHLVFSTLHTNDAASALARLIDMGIEPFLISSSVIAILAQRLVRVICPKCKEKYIPSDEILKDLKLTEKAEFYRARGCVSCKNTGFAGRIGIFELLLVNEDIKNMITARNSANDIKKKAVSAGMHTLFEDGLQKAKRGLTTVEEVLRVTEET
jgi:type IV pilus assembly protein PilB